MDTTKKKIAFIGWNAFQFNHILPLLKKMPQSKFILEIRNNKNLLNNDLEKLYGERIIRIDKHQMYQLNSQYDLLVCQTPFSQIFKITDTPIAMIQYGYAKEPHNYGAWRSLADVNLVYGDYAAKKIAHYSSVEITGNPSYDGVLTDTFIRSAHKNLGVELSDKKKTVLYAPTWGELSSLDDYLSEVCKLSSLHNVIIKAHHNTNLLEESRWQRICRSKVNVLGAEDSLLEAIMVSDVVISDYSGAIFDAIFCKKPVVLLNRSDIRVVSKIDSWSLEYAHRNSLGYQVDCKRKLNSIIKRALVENTTQKAICVMRSELFERSDFAVENAIRALHNAADRKYTLTQNQVYVRESVRHLYKTEYLFSQYKRQQKGIIRRLKSKIW